MDPFPGLDMRKVDMAAYNDARETLDKRQLQYYRVLGAMPSVAEDPNLHAAAHLYASDRNGLFPVSDCSVGLFRFGSCELMEEGRFRTSSASGTSTAPSLA